MPEQPNPLLVWLVLTAALAGLSYAFIRRELRVRATLYGAFLAAMAVVVWPPHDRGEQKGKIRLGLDLRGGIQFVLRVVTTDAMDARIDKEMMQVQEELQGKSIEFTSVRREDHTSGVIEGVPAVKVKDVQELLRPMFSGAEWEVQEPETGKFVVKLTDVGIQNLKVATVENARKILERRVNTIGVSEPEISVYGSQSDHVEVKLAGFTNVEEARKLIQRTGQLALKLVEDQAGSREDLLRKYGGKVPDDKEVHPGVREADRTVHYLVRKRAVVIGDDLRNAKEGVDEYGRPAVDFYLKPDAASVFARETGRNIGRQLAIVFEGVVFSAPEVKDRIGGGQGIISNPSGGFTQKQVRELVDVLKSGALPASMEILQQLTVGPSLGRDSIRSGVTASVAGALFIAVFMLIYYRLSGVNAIVALAANILILLGVMAWTGAVLTLPGIAGVILTVGVGVDTNVLVFERIREELRAGKTVKAAVTNGFERVWITILDTHATALIAAAFLYQFGTGAIKGFAVTLSAGLLANVFASYFVSKFLFEWALGRRPVQSLSI
jgi:preprotein translocase subunit SecD